MKFNIETSAKHRPLAELMIEILVIFLRVEFSPSAISTKLLVLQWSHISFSRQSFFKVIQYY